MLIYIFCYSLSFPSVTICNQNRVNCGLLEEGLAVSSVTLFSNAKQVLGFSIPELRRQRHHHGEQHGGVPLL